MPTLSTVNAVSKRLTSMPLAVLGLDLFADRIGPAGFAVLSPSADASPLDHG